jgi:hypothetical protein
MFLWPLPLPSEKMLIFSGIGRARERESKKAKEKSFDEADSTLVSANKQEFAKQGRRSVFHYQRN